MTCAELDKAPCGTLQAALLFWKELSGFLEEEGFEANPCDSCVMNENVNGKQLTVGWHADDLKASHVNQDDLEDLIKKTEQRFGKEAPLTINRGDVHEHLGMKIDFSDPGKVIFSMIQHIEKLMAEVPEELLKGTSTSPAANHLFSTNDKCRKLEPSEAMLHLTRTIKAQ